MSLKYKRSWGSLIFDWSNVIVICLIGFIMAYPLIWIISTSVSDPVYLSSHTVKFFPVGFQFDGYKFISSNQEIWKSYYNTIQYTVVGTIVTIVLCSLAAYVLSVPTYKPRKILAILFMITLFFYGGMIPTYLTISQLNMLDTIWAIVLPPAVNFWYIIILRTGFKMISPELREAALIDGANDFKIFMRIIVPLSKSSIVVILLFAAVGQWNNFFLPLLYLTDSDNFPLTIFLRNLLITSTFDTSGAIKVDYSYFLSITEAGGLRGIATSIEMAAIVITVLPIMCIYPFAQKYFVQGLLVGSIKG
jgi:putative aldouronate transport system permease protein